MQLSNRCEETVCRHLSNNLVRFQNLKGGMIVNHPEND
jgi:hypothetical protein